MFHVNDQIGVAVFENEQYSGSVVSMENDSLEISFDAESNFEFIPGQTLVLTQATKSSLFRMETTIVSKNVETITVELKPPQLVQRRRSDRASCAIEVWFAQKQTNSQDEKEDFRVPALVDDISVGGATLYSDMLLPADSILKIEFKLVGKETTVLQASVLRCTHRSNRFATKHENKHFEIAVKFVNMSRLDQLTLIQYLIKPLYAQQAA